VEKSNVGYGIDSQQNKHAVTNLWWTIWWNRSMRLIGITK